jgi:hypothetical protein
MHTGWPFASVSQPGHQVPGTLSSGNDVGLDVGEIQFGAPTQGERCARSTVPQDK